MHKFKVGFEIHQQLDTHKLFCNCPSSLEEEASIYLERRLRPTQSELGEIDRAALDEFLKGKKFIYEINTENSCLVEMDEEPPHDPNEEAIDTALEVSLMLNAVPVEEVHFMRKLVIDGSNTSGFQRTAIIAMNGFLETEEGKIRIPTVCLEEEAARIVGGDGNKTIYKLDRLGIPLVEITTAPDIKSPSQAKEVAMKIGKLLRDTSKVKRGIGTIRQDINISIEGGARVEIKGVQEIKLLPKIIENEIKRQEMLIEVKEKLDGVIIKSEITDVSDIFTNSKSKIISEGLKEGGVFAVKLNGFAGLLWKRLGPELAQYAKVLAGAKGIFHTDELPVYGISEEEVTAVSKKLGKKEKDAIVIVAGEKATCKKALQVIMRRVKIALREVPEETRAAKGDGSSVYMRTLPGAARMYPETDIPPVVITPERIAKIKLPELFEERRARYMRDYELSSELSVQLATSDSYLAFEKLVSETGAPPALIATTLLGTLKELGREGIKVENVTEEKLKDIFKLLKDGRIAKEAIPAVVEEAAARPEKSMQEVVKSTGIKLLDERELSEVVKKVIKERIEFVRERGMNAEKPLMGLVMKEMRGRVDGKKVSEVLREELKKVI